jgi:NADH:ubiquinone oxidoreductase subunit D
MNHLLALSCHSMDVGNLSPVFWSFEERERLMEFYERVSGARMHAAFYRPNDVDWTGLNYQFFFRRCSIWTWLLQNLDRNIYRYDHQSNLKITPR